MKKLLALILIISVLSCPVYAASEKYVYDTNIYMQTVDVSDGLSAYLRLPGYLGILKDAVITTSRGSTRSDVYVVYVPDENWDGDSYYGALNIRLNPTDAKSRFFFNGSNETLAWKCMYDDIFQPVDGGLVVFSGTVAQLNFTKGPGLYLGLGVIPYTLNDTGIADYSEALSTPSAAAQIENEAIGYSFILVLNDKMIDYYMQNGVLEKSSTYQWEGLSDLIESKRQKESSKLANFKQKYIYSYGQFTDIPIINPRWYDSAVKKVYELGFMMGNPDKTFLPAADISLAECLTIAARMNSQYNANAATFSQAGEKWYQTYVDYCISHGIIKSNDFKDYEVPATRGQMAYIFAKAVDQEALEVIHKDADFADVNAATAYDDEILSLAKAGIVQGDANGFRPTDNITRAEAAAILARIADTSLRIK